MIQFNDTSSFQEVIAIKDLLNKNTCPIAKCSLFDLDCSSPLPSNNVNVNISPLSLEAKTNVQEGYSIKFCLECLTSSIVQGCILDIIGFSKAVAIPSPKLLSITT